MKVCYDNIIYSLQHAGGISAYWSELSSRLVENEAESLFFGYENTNVFTQYLNQNVTKESCVYPKISRYLDFSKSLPRGSVFHSSYYRIPKQKDVAIITTVHDFTYEYYRKGLARFVHSTQKKRAIRNSDGIICVSENTKKDLLKFHPSIDEEKVKVIYNGVSDVFSPLENASQALDISFPELNEKKYLLYVGDRSGYKNFDIVMQVLKELDDFVLVVIGGRELHKKELGNLADRVFHYRGISAQEINTLYNNAYSLLYPSCYEGFGIPIAEAMKAGCPVISTNTSSIPEVAGDAALLVNEIDPASFIDAIIKLYDENFRGEIIRDGLKQAEKFNWDGCFEETYAFYNEVCKRKFTLTAS